MTQSDVIALPNVTPSFAASLIKAEEETGIPADSLAVAMFAESGLKADAANRSPDGTIQAAGILQINRGANLPGFTTIEQLEKVIHQSAEWQVEHIVIPYFKRFGSSVNGLSPGRLRLRMFLPIFANSSDETVVGQKGNGSLIPGGNITYDDVYSSNYGFDSDHDGTITVGDVIRNTESIGLNRGRIRPSVHSNRNWLYLGIAVGTLVVIGIGVQLEVKR